MEKIVKKIKLSMWLSALFLVGSFQNALADDSGFITDMPDLTEDKDRAGAMQWNDPSYDRSKYSRVLIDPITIYIDPDSKYKGLNPDDLKSLSDGFVKSMTKTLEPEIATVSTKGDGVLYIRAALVDVNVAKKKRGFFGYTPIGFIAGAAKNAAAGPTLTLKNVSLEMEIYDSATQKRLAVIVDKVPTNDDKKDDKSWDDVTETFDSYAKRFKAHLQSNTSK
jgi:hypothetical protein